MGSKRNSWCSWRTHHFTAGDVVSKFTAITLLRNVCESNGNNTNHEFSSYGINPHHSVSARTVGGMAESMCKIHQTLRYTNLSTYTNNKVRGANLRHDYLRYRQQP